MAGKASSIQNHHPDPDGGELTDDGFKDHPYHRDIYRARPDSIGIRKVGA